MLKGEVMRKIFKELKTPFLVTVVFTVICGLFYPLLITGLGQSIFPYQANGSLIVNKGKVTGSELIGQQFSDEGFMKGRPSAVNYNTYTAKKNLRVNIWEWLQVLKIYHLVIPY